MQLEKIDNIIFLKNIESNIMEEAFIVLKDNFKIDALNTNEKMVQTESNIIKEAEMIINEKIKESNIEYEKIKLKKIKKKYKFMKIINIILLLFLFCNFIL